MPPPKPKDKARVFHNSELPIGTTTMRADYLQWALPHGSAKPEQEAPKPTKFHGMTTTRADFLWPKECPGPKQAEPRPPHVVPAAGLAVGHIHVGVAAAPDGIQLTLYMEHVSDAVWMRQEDVPV